MNMKIKSLLMALAALLTMSCSSKAQKKMNTTGNNKVLVVFFSYSGNTRTVAKYIADATGGDMFDIQPVKAYPADYNSCVNVAKQEKKANARPAISNKLENLNQYDVVFIGYPLWWYTYPMIINTFFETYKLDGKTVIPFCTHGGGGSYNTFNEVAALTPNSKHKTGFEGYGGSISQKEVLQWLKNIGMVK
jgi:flavodoxin